MVIKKKSKLKSVKAKKSLRESVLQHKIVGSMTIMQVMQANPDSVAKLLNMGMGCCGCHFAMMETLEQGCAAHGLDLEEVLKELNN
jgi:hybrid cluster-associated redox disulfide protein